MTWASNVQAVQDEAGGLMELHVVRVADLPDLLDRVAVGDPEAGAIIRTLARVLQGIKKAPRKRPKLCACCPRPLLKKTPYAVVIAAPDRPDPTRCLTLAICEACATTPAEIRAKAMEAMRRIWPDARSVTVTAQHAPGHA